MGGVLSLLGWALPHKAPLSGHKRPLATHMQGAVLAFPDQDRSHTCSVRDRPLPQLCIDRKAGRHSPQPTGVVTSSMSPLDSRHAMIPHKKGWSGAGRVRIAAEQLQRPDQIYSAILPVTSRSPKKPQEASNISDEIHGAILR